MATIEPCHFDLVEIGPRIQARELSSLTATRAVLDRIGRLDRRFYATVTAILALSQVEEADAEIARGKMRGPLHGVPIAVKDLCETKGIPTAAGMAVRKDYWPEQDATVVTRLGVAGAVMLGKLQMTEGAFGEHHPTIDPPVNPWSAAPGPAYPPVALALRPRRVSVSAPSVPIRVAGVPSPGHASQRATAVCGSSTGASGRGGRSGSQTRGPQSADRRFRYSASSFFHHGGKARRDHRTGISRLLGSDYCGCR